MSFILFFLFRGCSTDLQPHLMDFGLMDVYVNDPKKMNQYKLLLEALNLSKLTMQRIAIGLEWVSIKLSIRVLPSFVFSKSFQDLESRASTTSCHYLIESSKRIIK